MSIFAQLNFSVFLNNTNMNKLCASKHCNSPTDVTWLLWWCHYFLSGPGQSSGGTESSRTPSEINISNCVLEMNEVRRTSQWHHLQLTLSGLPQ